MCVNLRYKEAEFMVKFDILEIYLFEIYLFAFWWETLLSFKYEATVNFRLETAVRRSAQ